MKKLIIYSLFLLVATTTFANAASMAIRDEDNIEKVSSNVLQHFGYTFYRATDVKWEINKNYQKAIFKLEGKQTHAIYDLNNNFLVATQIASINDLSNKAKESLAKNYADYKTKVVLRVIARPSNFQYNDDTSALWVELVSKDKYLVAVAMPNADLSIVKSEKVN